MKTKTEIILKALQKGKKLTALKAFYLCGTMRLAAVISQLKEYGHDIKTDYVSVKTKTGKVIIAKYYMK